LAILLGVVDDVRTSRCRFARWAKSISIELQGEEGKEILRNIKTIRQHFEPEVVAKEDAEKARKLKAATRSYRTLSLTDSIPKTAGSHKNTIL